MRSICETDGCDNNVAAFGHCSWHDRKRRFSELERDTAGRAFPEGDVRHGTTNGYVNLGCRCQRCKTAWAKGFSKSRVTRAERLRADPSIVEHGRYSTYTNWGCRCAPCTATNTKYWRDKRQANAK